MGFLPGEDAQKTQATAGAERCSGLGEAIVSCAKRGRDAIAVQRVKVEWACRSGGETSERL